MYLCTIYLLLDGLFSYLVKGSYNGYLGDVQDVGYRRKVYLCYHKCEVFMKLHRNRRLIAAALAAGAMLSTALPTMAASPSGKPELLFDKTGQWQLPYTPTDMVQSVDGKFIYILTDNHKLLIYEPNGNLKASVDVDPGVVAIDTDARGENVLLIDKDSKSFSVFSVAFVADVDTAGSPFKGKADAPVTIAVFSDFE